MIAVALRSMGQRKLRTALTAIAILLGVAMIAGTYVQTDQIRAAFDDILQTANAGVDANIAPRTEFTSTFVSTQTIDARMVRRAARVPGVDRAAGEVFQMGSLVVDGRTVAPNYAPAMVIGMVGEPFNPLKLVTGRLPSASGEIVVNRKLADDEHLTVGRRVGVTSRTGIHPARLVGIVDFGNVASMGGATMIVAPHGRRAGVEPARGQGDEHRRLGGAGRHARADGAQPAGGAAAQPRGQDRRSRRPPTRRSRSTTASARSSSRCCWPSRAPRCSSARSSSSTPSRSPSRSAAASSRCSARSAPPAARSSPASAPRPRLLGVVASVAGLLGGLGFSKLLGGLFDAAGMGIPRGAMELAPRTIVIALIVGVGVTLAAALLPAVRATRVPPVAAMREDVAAEPAGTSRRRLAAVAVLGGLGAALLVQGLFGSGAASSRLAAMGAGSLLVFVVVAMTARHAVRPLAALVGWPLERLGHTTGELARENSTRNPARTAITAAALMVGIALVVFVAVLADGMKTSFTGAIDQRASADLIVTSDNGMPLPRAARDRIQYLPDVSTATAQYLDQVKVNGKPRARADRPGQRRRRRSRCATSTASGGSAAATSSSSGSGPARPSSRSSSPSSTASRSAGASGSPGRPATRRRSPRSPSTATPSSCRA